MNSVIVIFVLAAFTIASCEEVKKCDYNVHETLEATKKIVWIGDENAPLSAEQHCKNLERNAHEIRQRSECLEFGRAKLTAMMIAKGALEFKEKNCQNEKWRTKFNLLSKCVQKYEHAANVHQCSYKFHDALKYGVQHIEKPRQLRFACCTSSLVDPCIYKYLEAECGGRIAEFATELFWDPLKHIFDDSCRRGALPACRELFPGQFYHAEEIFYSKEKLPPSNFFVQAYEVEEDHP